MALIHFDNFASYSSNSDGNNVYVECFGSRYQVAGRGAGKAIYLDNGSAAYVIYMLPSGSEKDTLYSGCAMAFSGWSGLPCLKFGSNSLPGEKYNLTHVNLFCNPVDKSVYVTRGNTILDTKLYPLTLNGFHFVEMGAKLHPSSGWITVKIDGHTVISISGVNTRQSGADTEFKFVTIKGAPTSATDWYICNDAGSSNNTFLGDISVKSISPSGNGASSDFTGSDSDKINNYQLVNSKLIYGASAQTSFVQSDGVGNIDTYAFEDVSGVNSVIAARVTGMIGKTDAGARTAGIVVRSGGSNYVSSDISPTAGVSRVALVYESNPDTGLAWNEAGINSAEFGVKVKA